MLRASRVLAVFTGIFPYKSEMYDSSRFVFIGRAHVAIAAIPKRAWPTSTQSPTAASIQTWNQHYTSAARLMFSLLVVLMTTACARVESIDQFGNRKVGWFMASNSGIADGDSARAVSVRGFGLHRVGPTWGLGVQNTRYVMLDEKCRVVVIKEYAEQPDAARALGLTLDEICKDSEPVTAWATYSRTHGG